MVVTLKIARFNPENPDAAGFRAERVGMSFDFEEGAVGIGLELRHQFVELHLRVVGQDGLA